MQPAQPIAVIYIAVLALIGAVFNLGCGSLGMLAVLMEPRLQPARSIADGLLVGAVLISLLGGLLDVAVAWALLAPKPWAWLLGGVAALLHLGPLVLSVLIGGNTLIGGLLGIGIGGLMLYFLGTLPVRQAFGRA
jgi:hypothetical protein